MNIVEIELTNYELTLDRAIVICLVNRISNAEVVEKSITYGALSTEAYAICGIDPGPRNLAEPLGRIQRYCRKCKLPTLAALVVRSQERDPGEGFYGLYRELYPDMAELPDEEIMRLAQNACMRCNEWQKLYDFLGIEEPAPTM